mgnify:CR=1 FL=1
MKKRFRCVMAILLTLTTFFTTSASALEGAIESASPKIAKVVNIAMDSMAEVGNAIIENVELVETNLEDNAEMLALHNKSDWTTEEIYKIYKEGYALDDIGKALDHDMEGTHVEIGVDVLKKFKENNLVINAVEAHHGDVEPKTVEAVLIQAADAISASRPGARRETLETYIKRLQKLEEICDGYKGVDKSYAIQAGREVRIIVKPEQVDDSEATIMARNIAKQIEAEMNYPGQIKVNVIRESRATEYAK